MSNPDGFVPLPLFILSKNEAVPITQAIEPGDVAHILGQSGTAIAVFTSEELATLFAHNSQFSSFPRKKLSEPAAFLFLYNVVNNSLGLRKPLLMVDPSDSNHGSLPAPASSVLRWMEMNARFGSGVDEVSRELGQNEDEVRKTLKAVMDAYSGRANDEQLSEEEREHYWTVAEKINRLPGRLGRRKLDKVAIIANLDLELE